MIKTKEQVKAWLDNNVHFYDKNFDYYEGDAYTINDDLTVDVLDEGCNVNVAPPISLFGISIKFNKVAGSFCCAGNRLESLEGCPDYVGGDFDCRDNRIYTLEGCPKYVGGNFLCNENPNLYSLEGIGEVKEGTRFDKDKIEFNVGDIYPINKYKVKIL